MDSFELDLNKCNYRYRVQEPAFLTNKRPQILRIARFETIDKLYQFVNMNIQRLVTNGLYYEDNGEFLVRCAFLEEGERVLGNDETGDYNE